MACWQDCGGQKLLLLVLVLACTMLAAEAEGADGASVGSFRFEIEAGPVWQSRNDVQIPNDPSGTRFSLVDVIGHGPAPSLRLYVDWRIAERHVLRALLAPLQLQETGMLEEQTRFAGATFAPTVPTEATYKFNSWRLGYRYRVHSSAAWKVWLGLTAKIRDAKIELRQGELSARKTDVGFVPLLHLSSQWRFASRWGVQVEVEGLAGGPGRAVDGAASLVYLVNEQWSLRGGYRTVEGGADVDEVYNFAWLHYAVLSISVRI